MLCFSSLRPHREMLDTAGDPLEAEGIGTVKLTLRGKFSQPLVLKNVYFAPRVGMNLISVSKLLRDRYSVVAHPQNIFLQRRGRTVGPACHTEEDLLILRCNVRKDPEGESNWRGRRRPMAMQIPWNSRQWSWTSTTLMSQVANAQRQPLSSVVKLRYSKKMRSKEWARPPKRCSTLGWNI